MVVARSSHFRSARSPVAVCGSALPRLVRGPDGHQAAVREDGTPAAGSALAYRGTWGRPFGGQHGDATVAMCTRARTRRKHSGFRSKRVRQCSSILRRAAPHRLPQPWLAACSYAWSGAAGNHPGERVSKRTAVKPAFLWSTRDTRAQTDTCRRACATASLNMSLYLVHG